ncbi:ferritin-like domain-containing protein [Fimbriiglobus ruber]|nr:ferritin-like domain-containing protein [Fimbriiglobus ruber]
MPLNSLHDLYVDELKDLYSAENQLLKALPKMAKKASAPELKTAFTEHLEVTRKQVERLEQIFTELGVSPKGKKCKAMEGLVEEGKEVLEEDGKPEVIDAALIACAQRVEHYEMAGYGCVRTFAKLLGYEDAEELLQATLDEEGEADQKLTELAETVINVEAEEAGDEGDEEREEHEEEGEGTEEEEESPAPKSVGSNGVAAKASPAKPKPPGKK